MTTVVERPAWRALAAHHTQVREVHLRQLFADDPQRAEHFSVDALGLYFDYSKHRVTRDTIRLLLQL
ncbi:MAG: glucose-6-phosphate isomerase, partial [Chloroflexi bacterium]|nr:glucose-6-phosphate isomerase [Chloroflexota bacterium]